MFYCLANLPTTMDVAGSIIHHLLQPVQDLIRRVDMYISNIKNLTLSSPHQLNTKCKNSVTYSAFTKIVLLILRNISLTSWCHYVNSKFKWVEFALGL